MSKRFLLSDITFPLTMYARKMFQSSCFNKLLKEENTVTDSVRIDDD